MSGNHYKQLGKATQSNPKLNRKDVLHKAIIQRKKPTSSQSSNFCRLQHIQKGDQRDPEAPNQNANTDKFSAS